MVKSAKCASSRSYYLIYNIFTRQLQALTQFLYFCSFIRDLNIKEVAVTQTASF